MNRVFDCPGFHHRVLFSGDTVILARELANATARRSEITARKRAKNTPFLTALFTKNKDYFAQLSRHMDIKLGAGDFI